MTKKQHVERDPEATQLAQLLIQNFGLTRAYHMTCVLDISDIVFDFAHEHGFTDDAVYAAADIIEHKFDK